MSKQFPSRNRNHSKSRDKRTTPKRSTTTDVHVINHGSIVLCYLSSRRASRWVEEHVTGEAQYFGTALVVEPRYVAALVAGMREDGLEVR